MSDYLIEQIEPDVIRIRETLTGCFYTHYIEANAVVWALRHEDGSLSRPKGVDLPDGYWAVIGYRTGLILKRLPDQP